MSLIYIVRHGQASFASAHYDQLSPLGQRQSRELGEDWVRRGLSWDVAVIGPKRRHQQTAAAVMTAYKSAGLSFPEPILVPEFDEHEGAGLVKKTLSNDVENDSDHALLPSHIKTESQINAYFQRFQELTRRWSRRELQDLAFEDWQAFRARVARGLAKVLAGASETARIVVFTSGGPVAACTGEALGLDDERVLELSWRVRNCALMEARIRNQCFELVSFNSLPHFSQTSMITDI